MSMDKLSYYLIRLTKNWTWRSPPPPLPPTPHDTHWTFYPSWLCKYFIFIFVLYSPSKADSNSQCAKVGHLYQYMEEEGEEKQQQEEQEEEPTLK